MSTDELRRRAEQVIAEHPERIKELPPEDIRELIHELQVHQAELEMQNDELRKAQLELEGSRKKYYELYDFAPMGYFTLDERGLILEVNLAGAELLGIERRYVIGSGFSRFLSPESQDRFYHHRNQAQATGLTQHCEIKIIRKDGTSFYVQLQIMAIRDDDDETIRFHLTTADITDRKLAEDELRKSHEFLEQRVEERTESLRESEAQYRELVQNANSIIYRRDHQGHIIFFNEYAQSFFGYSEEEIIGKHVVGTIVPEKDSSGRDLAVMIGDISQHPNRYATNINENMRRNGNRVWVSWTNKAIRDEHGDVREILCVGNDITALRETENALGISEERYRTLVENIGIGISLISPEMRVLALNRQMRAWFPTIDVTEHPLCYRSFNDPPRDKICSYCPTHLALRDGTVHEAFTETPAGVTYRIMASPIKDEHGTVTASIEMIEDISENLELRERLAVSEKLYETVFETTSTATVLIEDDMTVLLTNREFEHISGYRKEEIERKSKWTDFVSAADRERMEGYHRMRRTAGGSAPKTYTFSFIDRSGNEKKVLSTVDMIPGTKRSVASMLDITEQHRTQTKLQESEYRYRLLANNVSDVIWTADLDLHFTYVSPSFERLLGYSSKEIRVPLIDEILTPESSTTALELAEKFKKVIQHTDDKKRFADPKTIVLSLIRKDGTLIWTETMVTFIDGNEKNADMILGVTRDITQRKQAEEEQWESEHRYHLLFDSSPAGIFTYDSQLVVIDHNERFQSVIHSTRDTLIGLDLNTLNDQSIISTLSEPLEGRNGIFEGCYRDTTNETEIWITLKTAPLFDIDGTVTGGAGIVEDITDRVLAHRALEQGKVELELESRHLAEANTALKVLLNHIEKERRQIEEDVLSNIRELIVPFIEKIKVSPSKRETADYIQVLETNLNTITSPFLRRMTLAHYKLTPKELQVANLIKEGKATKEIADLLNVSMRSVEFHRDKIRKKLGLKHKKENLQSYLSSF